LSKGLVAVSTFGLLSFFCSVSLFTYLTWHLISWRLKKGSNTPSNQFLLLVYSLLFADIQQALAFLLNISALRNNGIFVETSTCFTQGLSTPHEYILLLYCRDLVLCVSLGCTRTYLTWSKLLC
jgi:hypothetical protein